MKATCKPILYTTKGEKKNGKFPVKLSVIFQRFPKNYSLGIDLTQKEFSEYHINRKLRHVFDDISYYQKKAQDAIDELKDGFTWELFEKGFLKKQANAYPKYEVLPALLQYSTELRTQERVSSAESYKLTYTYLSNYAGGNKVTFHEMNSGYLKGFDKSLKEKGLSNSTIGITMRNLRAVFNKAINIDKIVSAEFYPFGKDKYSPPSSKKTKKALDMDEIGRIFSYKPETETEAWAKDMWVFAYLGNGMNLKDIALLRYKNIVGGDEINFVREKSKNSRKDGEITIRVMLTDELKDIILKWGKKKKDGKSLIFDIIANDSPTADEIYKEVKKSLKTINKYMKRIAQKLGLEKAPTTNFARHSFATVLKRAGVGIEMISEQLGHSSIKTTEIYLSNFEKEQRKELPKHLIAFKNTKEAD